jgi:predicted PurR-regulated permease PerM
MMAERLLLLLLVGGVAVGCIMVLSPFISALLWAAILVFTTWPVAEWLRINLRLPRSAVAGLMVLLTSIVLVLPIALAAPGGVDEISALRGVVEDALRAGLPGAPLWIADVPVIGPTITELWNRWAADVSQLLEALRPYFGTVVEGGLSLLLGIANGILMVLIALFIAFFFFIHGEPLAERLSMIVHRIGGMQADRLMHVAGATVRGVVYGVVGTSIVQGILTVIGLWVSGVPRAAMLGIIAGLLSVLPIGAPVIWIPASIWLMSTGSLGWGIFLAIWGALAISGSDNFIRPWFISRGAQLPFLVTVMGVLGGALAFGLLGIFLGPVLLGLGYTLVNEWANSADPTPTVDSGIG